MRVLTWLPRDLRQQLTELDPGREMPTPVLPPADALVNRDGDGAVDGSVATRSASWQRRPNWRWMAPVLAATAVLAIVGAVTVVRLGSHHQAAAPPSIPSVPTNPSTTDAAARLWMGFPVGVEPRPVVLLGPQTDGPIDGFRNSDDKLAFLEGRLNWPASVQASLPAGPPTTLNYPLLTAQQAFALLPHYTKNPPTPVTLQVTEVALTMHGFYTDRGTQQLPAWEFRLGHVTNPVYVLAVAASGRYPTHLADGNFDLQPATLGTDGRHLTIRFVAHQDPTSCMAGYDSTLNVAQTRTAVVLAVTITHNVPATSNDMMLCAYAGPLTPGAPHTRTITLDQPLGARVVVDRTGQPYQVTSG